MLGGVTGDEKFESPMSIVMVTAELVVFATRSEVPNCCEKLPVCRPAAARPTIVTPEATVN